MSESRAAILAERFMHEGEHHEEQVWDRTARTWATNSYEHGVFKELMEEQKGCPNTPAVANAGRDPAMASACFVLPIPDDLSGIMTTLHDAALVHKSGGGTGFDFSQLRRNGALVRSTGRPAPGPVSYLRMYSDVIRHVTQAGMRPGANMGMIHCDHPDALEFAVAKRREGDIKNFNISVQLTDDFMTDHAHSALWETIVHGAWANGEPGAFFIDTANRSRLHPEKFAATNPCGEVPLLPYEACVLGSVNIAAHVVNGRIDFDELEQSIHTMTRMLDNIIDRQDYPLPIIEQTHKRYRKIGVNPAGLADTFVMCGIPYDSDRAVAMSYKLACVFQRASYDASYELALERGPYPGHHGDMPWRRNLCAQVGAPTGTTSRLLDTSFAIQPHMGRQVKSYILGRVFEESRHLFADSEHFRTTAEVGWEWQIQHQAAWQRFTDQAVSYTINMPHEATVEDVADAYHQAWLMGCKGITVLRQDARENNVIEDCEGGACPL